MKNNMKKVVTAGLAGFVLGTTLTVSAGTWIQAYRNDEIKIALNGKVQTFRDATTNEIEVPITYNNRTYLPLRSLATLVGLNVDYDANTKTAILETKDYEDELIQKYKLSDSYILNGKDAKAINFNIIDSSYNMETGRYESVVANQEVISDGIKFKIECNKVDTNKYEVKINGESLSKEGHFPGTCVGVIDMDSSDEYKEIVVRTGAEATASYEFYKLTKKGIELIYQYEADVVGATEIILMNNKYIIPIVSSIVSENLIFGYYMYEDGEFKFIDRFLTGEKITDEEGNYPEKFKNQIFSVSSEGSYCLVYYKGNIVPISGKVKLLKQNKNENGYIYDVELVEDATTWLGEQQITLPKGTKLIYDK